MRPDEAQPQAAAVRSKTAADRLLVCCVRRSHVLILDATDVPRSAPASAREDQSNAHANVEKQRTIIHSDTKAQYKGEPDAGSSQCCQQSGTLSTAHDRCIAPDRLPFGYLQEDGCCAHCGAQEERTAHFLHVRGVEVGRAGQRGRERRRDTTRAPVAAAAGVGRTPIRSMTA